MIRNGRCSFIFTTLFVYTTTTTISNKNPFPYFPLLSLLISYLTFPLLLFSKIVLTTHTNTLFLYTAAFFSLLYFCVQPPQQSTSKAFSLPQLFSRFRLHQRTEEQQSFVWFLNLSLLPQSMDSDNRVHNN